MVTGGAGFDGEKMGEFQDKGNVVYLDNMDCFDSQINRRF